MRKFTLLKILVASILILVSSTRVSAQLLIENFDYTIGSVLTTTATADPTTKWASHSGNGTQNIDVTAGLTFAGYAGSGIGGAANLDNNGQDINRTFTSQTSGTIYAAFVISASASNSAGYFFHLGQSTIGTTFFSRVWINATGDGVGIGASAPTNYISITAATPTLLVVKYDITTKLSSLFVLKAFSATEPTTADATYTETSAISDVGCVALRQYNAAEKVIVDGIRVGTTWAQAVAPPSTTPITKTPEFSPIPGDYITTQNVTLTSETGASIYYTTDGSQPNNTGNGTLYASSPIPVSSTTTIKAIAYKTGSDPSSIATGIYTFPTDVKDIATLRSSDVSGFYRLTGEGVITLLSTASTGSKTTYIQDATAAIMIYDATPKITTVYALGDGIKNLYCTLSMYNGMLELIPYADPGAASSTGNTVTPKVITLDQLANYPAQLVKISNLTVSDLATPTVTFQSGKNYPLSDGTNSGLLRTAYGDLDYIGKNIPISAPQTITGVVLNTSSTTSNLVPRSFADMVTTGIFTPKVQDLNARISGNNVLFNASAGETVEIFNSVGQRIISQIAVDGQNAIPVTGAKGVLVVKVANRVSKVIL